MRGIAALLLCALVRTGSAASTDTVQPNPFAAMKDINNRLEAKIDARLLRGDYLGAVRDSEAEIKQADGVPTLSFLLDIHSSFLAFAGKDGEARISMARSGHVQAEPPVLLRAVEGAEAARREVRFEEPEAVLREAAKTHRIIMFSEAHHIPEHRALGARLLPVLKELGFTVLAMEALKDPVPEKPRRVGRAPGPGVVYGYYAREPRMANLMREALRLGFTLVAYEDETTDGKRDREEVQAQNLVERVFAKDPKAKVVVWAGYGHIYKNENHVGRTMALRLWQKTGLEPFCLFQLSDSLDPDLSESPLYRNLMLDAASPPDHPVVVRNRKGLYPALDALELMQRSPSGAPIVDGYILHPPFREHAPGSLRPAWLHGPGLLALTGTLGRRVPAGALLQAFPKAEGPDSTPTDQMELDASGRFELRLPPGDYLLRALGEDGKVLLETTARPGGPALTLTLP